jgi:hypothetical protein
MPYALTPVDSSRQGENGPIPDRTELGLPKHFDIKLFIFMTFIGKFADTAQFFV